MAVKSSQPLPQRDASGRRERKPTNKIIQKQAEEVANAERLRDKKERKAHRARAHARQVIGDDDEDSENEDDDENTFVDSTFTTRMTTSKPQTIKEKALVMRTTRVPFSEVHDNPRHHLNEAEQVERGRTIQRSTQRHVNDSPNCSQGSTSEYSEQFHGDLHSNTRSQSYSRSPSPSISTLAGQKRRASSSDSIRDIQTARHSKGGRPKAGDYDDVIQAILSHATKEYRCKISTLYAYPGTSQIIAFSTESWDAACQHLGINESLTPRITRVIVKGTSQLRGELKTKAQPLVEAHFGFDSANNKKAIKKNRQMAEFLKEKHNFIFNDLDFTTDPPTTYGIYQSKLIQKIVNRMWFVNPRDEGIVFDSYFNPITKECLALVLTAIEACIDEWVTGVRMALNFTGSDYESIYKGHINELERFEKHTIKHELLARILLRLYNRGRFHAGAQPLSTVGFPVIPESAFDKAIKEYEDGSGTDTDGESGERDY